MLNSKQLEFICDEIANDIESANGTIDVAACMESHIDKFLEENNNDKEELQKAVFLTFNELFKCDPNEYARDLANDFEMLNEVIFSDDFVCIVDDDIDELLSISDDNLDFE